MVLHIQNYLIFWDVFVLMKETAISISENFTDKPPSLPPHTNCGFLILYALFMFHWLTPSLSLHIRLFCFSIFQDSAHWRGWAWETAKCASFWCQMQTGMVLPYLLLTSLDSGPLQKDKVFLVNVFVKNLFWLTTLTIPLRDIIL